MKIVVDVEAFEIVKGLCDIALKSGGMRNLPAIESVLSTIMVEDNQGNLVDPRNPQGQPLPTQPEQPSEPGESSKKPRNRRSK